MMIENILCMTLLSMMYLQLRSHVQVEAVFVHDSNLTIYSHMSICIFSLPTALCTFREVLTRRTYLTIKSFFSR